MNTKSDDPVTAVSVPTDHVEKAVETEEVTAKKAMAAYDLTPKQQYQRLWFNLKKDKRYVLWSLYIMSLVFGWGYDSGLSGVAIAFPEFRKAYGEYYEAGDQFVIPALWQSLWNAASTIGQVLGAFLTGQFADYFGRRPVLWAAVVLSISSSFALVFAPSLPVLFVSKLLLGLSVGLSTATPPLYVTENAPAALRSSLSSLTNVIIVLGFFLSSITGWGSSKIHGEWSYRLAFVMTFLVPTLFAIVLPFLPESPVWYVKKGRDDDARKAIIKLYGKGEDVEERLNFIKSELEVAAGEANMAKQTSWRAIFSKEHRSRTLVAVLGLQSQNFSGGYFASMQHLGFECFGRNVLILSQTRTRLTTLSSSDRPTPLVLLPSHPLFNSFPTVLPSRFRTSCLVESPSSEAAHCYAAGPSSSPELPWPVLRIRLPIRLCWHS